MDQNSLITSRSILTLTTFYYQNLTRSPSLLPHSCIHHYFMPSAIIILIRSSQILTLGTSIRELVLQYSHQLSNSLYIEGFPKQHEGNQKTKQLKVLHIKLFRKELIPLGAWLELVGSPLVDNCSKKRRRNHGHYSQQTNI